MNLQYNYNLKPFEQRRTEFMKSLYEKYSNKPLNRLNNLNLKLKSQTSNRSSAKYQSDLYSQSLIILPDDYKKENYKQESSSTTDLKNIEQTPVAINFDEFLNSNYFKYLIYNKNFSKLKSIMNISSMSSNETFKKVKHRDLHSFASNSHSSLASSTTTSNNLKLQHNYKRKKLISFKQIAKFILVIVKMLNIQKATFGKLENFIYTKREKLDLFERDLFSKPKEPAFPDEAKKMLQLDPLERSEEMLRYIIISLNFSIPEFSEYPVYMQKMIAKYSYYQEFEPGRVIIRQGHQPDNYYIIISGNALEIITSTVFLASTPISAFKRGDSFGDKAIINNTLRPTSVTVHGIKPISLLCIEKEDFYRIQTPLHNKNEKLDFLKKQVEIFQHVNYPFDLLDKDNRRNQAYCSMYFKNGILVTENSQLDEWIYVIKSGFSKVLKRIKFNQNALELYLTQNKRNLSLTKIIELSDLEKTTSITSTTRNITNNNLNIQPCFYFKCLNKFIPFSKELVKNLDNFKEDNVYLEVNKLKKGDVFGLHDIILTEENDNRIPLMLCSEGCEFIMISKRYFLKYLPSQSMLTFRFNLHPYPNDDYFIRKYFHAFRWKDFKYNCKYNTLKKLYDKKTNQLLLNSNITNSYSFK